MFLRHHFEVNLFDRLKCGRGKNGDFRKRYFIMPCSTFTHNTKPHRFIKMVARRELFCCVSDSNENGLRFEACKLPSVKLRTKEKKYHGLIFATQMK